MDEVHRVRGLRLEHRGFSLRKGRRLGAKVRQLRARQDSGGSSMIKGNRTLGEGAGFRLRELLAGTAVLIVAKKILEAG